MNDKKLRKKVKRLVEWAKRHGYDYVDVSAHRTDQGAWYSDITVRKTGTLDLHSVSNFWKEDEQ